MLLKPGGRREHTDCAGQAELEQSLITHNHLDLLARLREHREFSFGTPHNDLLQLLGTFYKTLRYDRFSLDSIYKGKKEAAALKALLGKHLAVQFPTEPSPFGTFNEDRYRAFIRRTVLKISRSIYETIRLRSQELRLYTYELRHASKAQSVFLREVDVGEEDILWKELLVFLMQAEPSTAYLQFIRSIEPLGFDPGLLSDYLDCFKSDAAKSHVMDELEHHYGEMDPIARKERLQMIRLIGADGVEFGDPEEEPQ